jgi:hypothetical protein
LADTVAKMAGVAKEHVKILDCQCGSVIASTVIMAPDWSVASAKLEISLMDESGPLKHMGVVGCAGLLGGVVGKPPLPATAAAAAAAAAARLQNEQSARMGAVPEGLGAAQHWESEGYGLLDGTGWMGLAHNVHILYREVLAQVWPPSLAGVEVYCQAESGRRAPQDRSRAHQW